MSEIQQRDGFIPNLTLEDVRIMFRNFKGVGGDYNAEGDRNFVVFLDPATAEDVANLGWSVKHLRPREEGDDPQAILKVKVKYSENGRPPRVVMITSRGRTPLGEDMIDILDWVDIQKVDLIVRPYKWERQGRKGVTAYLVSIYVTIREDELEKKYADVPEIETGRGNDSAQLSLTAGATPDYEDLGEYAE